MEFRDPLLTTINVAELQERIGEIESPAFREALLFVASRILPQLKNDAAAFSLLISVLSIAGRARFLDELFSVAVLSDSLKQTLISQIARENQLARSVHKEVIEAAGDEASTEICIDGPVEHFTRTLSKRLHALVRGEACAGSGLSGMRARLAETAALYGLSQIAVDVLVVLFLYHRCGPLARVCDQDRPVLFAIDLAELLDVSRRKIADLLLTNGTLIRHYLVTEEVWEEPPFKPTEVIRNALEGTTESQRGESCCLGITTDNAAVYPLDSFAIDQSVRSVLVQLASSEYATHILLYGAAGAGKTELARSVARATGKITSIVQFPAHDSTDLTSVADRVGIIRRVAASLQKDRSILIIDEADAILNTEEPFGEMSKEPLVHLMESLGICAIWISNSRNSLHPAIVRRFSYSLAFDRADERIALSRLQSELIAANRSLPAPLRTRIVRDYPVSLGSISKAVHLANSICAEEAASDFAGILEHLVQSESTLLTGSPSSRSVSTLTGARYLDDVLNCTPSTDCVLAAVQRFTAAAQRGQSGPLNILLFGAAGTGKSAFAHRLAEQAGIPLHEYSGADLLHSPVGETEQAIRDLFSRADGSRAIVLLDEAESLLQDRSTARNGWERQHVNEFLNRMERHKTIFLCSTNQLSLMDPATLRRFAFKVEFFPLKPEDRVRSYRAHFVLRSRRLTPPLKHRIESMHGLTLGTIRTVFNQIQLQDPSTVSHARIIDLLRAELQLCRPNEARPVGFCA